MRSFDRPMPRGSRIHKGAAQNRQPGPGYSDSMPRKEIIEEPLEIYRPFTVEESTILRDFVANARLLGKMSLFEQTPKQVRVTWDARTGPSTEMAEPSDESVRAALTVFRQLYTGTEPHSFNTVIKLLKRSVHEHNGPRRQEALDFLSFYPEEQKSRMQSGIGIAFESPDGTQRERSRCER